MILCRVQDSGVTTGPANPASGGGGGIFKICLKNCQINVQFNDGRRTTNYGGQIDALGGGTSPRFATGSAMGDFLLNRLGKSNTKLTED